MTNNKKKETSTSFFGICRKNIVLPTFSPNATFHTESLIIFKHFLVQPRDMNISEFRSDISGETIDQNTRTIRDVISQGKFYCKTLF